jgi:hypothetical protein
MEKLLFVSTKSLVAQCEKGCRKQPFLLILMVARDGIEPPTRGFSVLESILAEFEYVV